MEKLSLRERAAVLATTGSPRWEDVLPAAGAISPAQTACVRITQTALLGVAGSVGSRLASAQPHSTALHATALAACSAEAGVALVGTGGRDAVTSAPASAASALLRSLRPLNRACSFVAALV